MSIKQALIVLGKFFGGKKELYAFLFIILLSIIFRFANYDNRFGLAADQARDILIVRHAINTHSLPLIGPFSASGPFVFGPYWYWIFTIPVFFFPNSLLAPWIFQSTLYVLSVFLMFLIGKDAYSSRFGLLLSLFTAISTSEIKLSTNIIMSALVGIFSFFIFYLFLRYVKNKKLLYIVMLSFFISIAINTHFEAVPLIFFLLFALIFGKRNFFHFFSAGIVFLIPFIPLFIFNIVSHNYELSHITQLHQTIPAGTSFFRFVRAELGPLNFFPRVWGDTVGGSTIAGWLMISTFIGTLFFIFFRKNNREVKMLAGIFLCIMSAIVAYEGKLFENFLSCVFPLMIFFTSLACYYLMQFNKKIGTLIIAIILLFTVVADITTIKNSTNNTLATARYWEKFLLQTYPNQQFAVYNYSTINTDKSIPLSLLLAIDKKSSKNGFKIGVAYDGAPIFHQVLLEGPAGLRLYNLQGADGIQLKKENFSSVNPDDIYNSVENWYK